MSEIVLECCQESKLTHCEHWKFDCQNWLPSKGAGSHCLLVEMGKMVSWKSELSNKLIEEVDVKNVL